jgi:hypothetical protein
MPISKLMVIRYLFTYRTAFCCCELELNPLRNALRSASNFCFAIKAIFFVDSDWTTSSQQLLSCFVDFTVIEDDCCWDDLCCIDADLADICEDCAEAEDAEACSCIARRFNQADVTDPCAGISETARAARAEEAAAASLAMADEDCVVASLANEEDLAYLSLSSLASYRLPLTHFLAKRSLNVRAPGVSPLVPLSVSR